MFTVLPVMGEIENVCKAAFFAGVNLSECCSLVGSAVLREGKETTRSHALHCHYCMVMKARQLSRASLRAYLLRYMKSHFNS